MAEYCGGVCSIRPVKRGSSSRMASAEGLDFAGLDDPALGIVGIAFLAPGDRESIAFAAVHHERDGLGGFAERDRQAAGGERIERAGMAGALGLEQPFHHRDRLGRGHADRLVEHDPAMDVALVAPRLVVRARLLAAALPRSRGSLLARSRRSSEKIFFSASCESAIGGSNTPFAVLTIINHSSESGESGARSLCTAGVRSNFSIRSASSNRSSARKRTSGANFKLTRCAISPRRNFLFRSSAAITTVGVASAERHHIDGRKLQVRRHPHLGHGDDMALEFGVVHATLRKNVGDRMAHGFADPQLALRAAGGGIFLWWLGIPKIPNCVITRASG